METILGSHLPEYSKTFHGKTIISGATIWLDRAHTSRRGLVSRPRIEARFASPWEPKASSVPRNLRYAPTELAEAIRYPKHAPERCGWRRAPGTLSTALTAGKPLIGATHSQLCQSINHAG